MNFGAMFKAIDTMMALKDAVGRMRAPAPPREQGATPPSATSSTTTQPIEARLTGIVLAALKEAFDRDHSRLELEREQFEQQQRRAEEALKLEAQRQRADRDLTRLRLLAGMALLAWLGSMVAVAVSGLAASLAPGSCSVRVGCCSSRRSRAPLPRRSASVSGQPQRPLHQRPRPRFRSGCCSEALPRAPSACCSRPERRAPLQRRLAFLCGAGGSLTLL
jgi:hypothetical protein